MVQSGEPVEKQARPMLYSLMKISYCRHLLATWRRPINITVWNPNKSTNFFLELHDVRVAFRLIEWLSLLCADSSRG
jgi:hypothetical protein